jgi:hypothetical protein
MKYIFAGDSWALKGFTNDNYDKGNSQPLPGDVRLADHWPWQYQHCLAPGQGNLACLDRLVAMRVPATVPVIWVWTEPGRDYGRIRNAPAHEWIEREDIFSLRTSLNHAIMSEIRDRVSNPIAFIGGLSDVDPLLAQAFGFDVLCESWQSWIAAQLDSKWFKMGWGASDVGWRMHSNGITPGKTATFAWDEQIKEWCWWEEQGYFCHEHPTPRANEEFAQYLQPKVEQWLKNQTS